MAEFMTGMKRTDYCGDLRIGDVGREVTVCGWVQRCRDLGQLIFIDLRDRTGIVQLAFNDKTDKEIFDKAFSCRSEFVLAAKGVVCERSSKNSEIPTGDIEVVVSDMRVLSKAQTPPFEIVDDTNTNEELRLKYRYLDLRRRPLLNNLMMRSKIAKVARDYFHDNSYDDQVNSRGRKRLPCSVKNPQRQVLCSPSVTADLQTAPYAFGL